MCTLVLHFRLNLLQIFPAIMRRRCFYKGVLCCIAWVSSVPISFSQNSLVTGKVKHNKEILQSATVSLGNKTALTDHKGEFTFSVKPGTYTVTITHVGDKKIEQPITAVAGSTKTFDFNMELNEELGDVVVLGSRSLVHRSNLNTPVPVDAFSSTELAQTGQTSLMQMLNFTSYRRVLLGEYEF